MPAKTAIKTPLKVLFVSAEVAPFSHVGGLSQVSYFLPRALVKLGVDVRVFTPRYGNFKEDLVPLLRPVIPSLIIDTGEPEGSAYPRQLEVAVKTFKPRASEPIIYLLENLEYYQHRANVYMYGDDHIRFSLLSKAALVFIKRHTFKPDLIHVNDWHTSYLLNYLRDDYAKDPELRKIAGLLTIHNTYQGNFDFQHAPETDFDDGISPLVSLFSERLMKQNALKRGAINADLINTVSQNYARELLHEEVGAGLHRLFRELRSKLEGVVNGLDYSDFDPLTDPFIKHKYSHTKLGNRAANKLELQRQFGLDPSPDTPLIAMSGRLTVQKGVDLIMKIINFVLTELDTQLVVMGPSDSEEYRRFFSELEKKYPGRVGTHLQADFSLPRQIFAGADMILMPSKYEPGGIVALEALRYGCVPIARATGGLADTLQDYDSRTGRGWAFVFKKYSEISLLVAIVRAIEAYKNPTAWQRIIRNGMRQDYSWNKTARDYLKLYERAINIRRESLQPNPPMAFKQTIRP